ncbi:MAG: hypothetical protein JO147_11690, partial [Actinobacteria bacterium]|nr:hypothetical protein [Actinomycetota bacterium]
MTAIRELRLASPVEQWRRLGLPVEQDRAYVGSIALTFVPGDQGIVSWTLSALPSPTDDIDGLATRMLDR